MSGVVCAIKGGVDSQPTVAEAIRIAKAEGLPLYFLHIISLQFLERTVSSRAQMASKELFAMGEFIMANAVGVAEAGGVTAQGNVRKGPVVEEIIQFCKETEATYLVIGQPRKKSDDDLFSDEQFKAFVGRIGEETGTRVVVTAGENG